jgi:hypothetical protein
MFLAEAHKGISEGHYAGKATTHKVFRIGLWWQTIHKDEKQYFQSCDVCRKLENPTRGMRCP